MKFFKSVKLVFSLGTTQVAEFYKDILSFNHQLTTVNCYLLVDAPLNTITGEETLTKGGKIIKLEERFDKRQIPVCGELR